MRLFLLQCDYTPNAEQIAILSIAVKRLDSRSHQMLLSRTPPRTLVRLFQPSRGVSWWMRESKRFMAIANSHEAFRLARSTFPQIDIIGAMVIIWRVRGKIIRSVL